MNAARWPRRGPRVHRLAGLLLLASAVAGSEPAQPALAPVDAAPPGVRDAGVPGVPVQERLAEVQRRVQAALHYPESALARGVGGEARVGFEIRPDGRATNVTLLESTGSSALDDAAQRAVRDAEDLPPVLGRVAIPVRFELVHADGAHSD